MQTRAFNKIEVDYNKGVITKSSSNINKLKDEINYYLSLPKSLLKFFPKLINYKDNYSAYTIEYFPYKTISEIIASDKLTLEKGKSIISQLINTLDKIHQINGAEKFNYKNIQDFYINKTISRIEDLKQNKFIQPIVDAQVIYINDRCYKNFQLLKDKFIQSIHELIDEKSELAAIHGDFCFSNILYNIATQHIKLIDPRGSFCSASIYGDKHYDFAKILHCLHGRYDCLVKGNFELQELQPNCFLLKKAKFSMLDKLYDFYKELLSQRKINFRMLLIIEASLFLSMSSLHYENLQRQKALYLTGIMILNDFFENTL